MLLTVVYFVLALFILVIVHEYGHFIIARLCNVKVVRVSFGFGRVLAYWHDKKGTQYAWSLIPLGGYVKMLDETQDYVLPHERHLAFNNKPVIVRMLIVVAGPVFNFIFSFAALWLVLVLGIHSLAPIIDNVKVGSPSALAGLKGHQEIIALNGKPIASWHDFHYAMMPLIGSVNDLSIDVVTLDTGLKKTIKLPLSNWQLDAQKSDLLSSLGIHPFLPTIPTIVGDVMPESPAMRAGIHINDYIKQMNGKPLIDWLDLVKYVKKSPNKSLELVIERAGKQITLIPIVGSRNQHGHAIGFLGIHSLPVDWPKQWLRFQHQSPFLAIITAFHQTNELIQTTFGFVGHFITGKLTLQHLSGPVGMAQSAGQSARGGFAYYLSFLALMSISLGVLNLLPIPMLDGGHLLFFLIELVQGKALSDTIKTIGLYIGIACLIVLMLLALNNDLARL